MIKPVEMGKVNFNGYTILGEKSDETNKSKNVSKPENTRSLTKSEKNIFVAGALLGAMMGVVGTNLYNDNQTKDMINDMKMELDACHDQDLIIEDVTGDKVPDIIFEDMYGDAVYYDFMKHNVLLRMGDETEEKIR